MDPTFNAITIERAQEQLGRGDLHGALDSLRRALSLDPADALAHALLAVVLVNQKRLHAAAYEAAEALTLDPELPWAHYAAAVVAIARKKLDLAQEHLDRLFELEPEDDANYLLQAQLHQLRGERQKVRGVLERARTLNPESPRVRVALGEHALEQGRLDDAEALAQEVLEEAPEYVEGLVLMGRVRLRRGETQAALEHAHWALRINAADAEALRLLSDVKARSNLLLGIWWRYATWMQGLDSTRSILLLLGAFLVYRFAALATADAGWARGSELVTWVWMGLCAYTWFAPELYRRMVARELQQVQLRPDF